MGIKKLRKDLEELREKNTSAKIDETMIDITDCFGKRFPKNFGEDPIVLGYTVRDGLNLEKYSNFSEGMYQTKKDIPYFTALSCLCVKPIQNTSFSEVYHLLKDRKRSEKAVGFRKNTLDNLVKRTGINPENDQIFMFAADKRDELEKRARLSQVWLKQMMKYGGETLDISEKEEHILMQELYGELLQEDLTQERVRPYSYMPGKPYHTEESEIFLLKKLQNLKK